MNHKPSVFTHCLVKNESRWLWFAVCSVINDVDKVLLWDTGSTDGSLEIEEELKKRWPDKIILKNRPQKTAEEFTQVRQEMLEATTSDWFLMLDGDEVWWDESIKKVVDLIRKGGEKLESIVVPTINPVGDIFHYQEEEAGRYKLAGRLGHLALRGVNRKIPGLNSSCPHGRWGWTDGEGKMIQDRDPAGIFFVDAPYLHLTHLERTEKGKEEEVVKRAKKLKYEIGKSFPLDFYYPEVFFRPRPEIVPSPWERMSNSFKVKALIETPLKKIKRRVWQGKTGY